MRTGCRLTLVEQSIKALRVLEVGVEMLVIAGWTGRDAAAVQAHIRELQAIGVAPPPRTPMFYRVAAGNLTTASHIEVAGRTSSGEAEVVLIMGESRLWIGLGSDHTDRELEKRSITLSKQICPKPIAPAMWPHEEVAPHWDRLELRSYARIGGELRMYQRGGVAALANPLDLARAHWGEAPLPAGTALYCGTVPVEGDIAFADGMILELHDPVLNRSLRHEYSVGALDAEY